MSLQTTWCILLAGGIGSRLAPLSTPERPKQVLPLLPDGRSPLRASWDRVAELFGVDRVLVVTGRSMEPAVRAVLPELPHAAFLIEPEGRNTLPALLWASAEVARRGGAALVSQHADHRVDDEAAFARVAARAAAETPAGDLILVGLVPTWANPALGWIVPGEAASEHSFRVDSFVEKPPRERAESLMRAGALWNLGLFAWSIDAFAREIAGQPAFTHAFEHLLDGAPIADLYPRLPRISVDHGLIEGAARRRVLPARFDWSDLGTWESLGRTAPP